MRKFLDPKNDVAFKYLFGQEKNKDILISLLNAVLKNQLSQPIEDVRFLKPIQEPDALSKKQSVVDVLCRDQAGNRYIIEMQVARTKGFEKRAQYYASKAFTSQMSKGGKYEHLREVIFLAFTDFSLFPGKKDYKSEHQVLDVKTKENNLDKLSFTFVDLVKFDQQTKGKPLSSLSLEEKFYYFLRHAPETKLSELKELTSGDIVIERAYNELEEFGWDDDEVAMYESVKKGIMDNQSAIDYAEERGIKKGIKEGIGKGKKEGIKEGIGKGIKEGIKKGIKEGIGKGIQKAVEGMYTAGIPIAIIAKSVGLSEEEIKNKLKENK